MSKRVVAVYNDFETARQVVEALVDAGFERTAISLIGNDVSGEYRNRLTTETHDDEDVSSGEGAGFGAVVGALVGLGVALIPGIGPVLAAGPLAAALMAGIGAVAGAATGGVVAGLVDFGIPEEEANIYAENIRRGGTLVAIEVDDNRVGEAQSIMNRYNPIDVEESESTLRTSGWSQFDASAEPYTASAIATSASPAINMTTETTYNATTSSTPSRTSRNVGSTGKDEERLEVVEEELQVGKREVEGGAVRVRSYVTETPVEEQVTLREETVHIDRRPVDRAATSADLNAFQEKTIEMQERHEEAVVSKTARVVEEVVISKDVSEHTETIRDTVRRTDVAVEGATGTTSGSTTFRPYTDYETNFRTHYTTNYGSSGNTYEQYSPAYRYGYTLATNDRFSNYSDWNSLESEARTRWEERNPNTWDQFKDSIRNAWMEVTGRR